jgi:hypothetical protein
MYFLMVLLNNNMSETKNIKDLPKTDSMVSGDYFLIETDGGTNLLNFDNFVIDQDNTTFAADLITNVDTLSSLTDNLSAAIDLSNPDSSIAIVNENATVSLQSLTDNLYGTEGLKATLTELADLGDLEGNGHDISSHLAMISAVAYEESKKVVESLSAQLLGAVSGTTLDEMSVVNDFKYVKGNIAGAQPTADTPEVAEGGWLGTIYNTLVDKNPSLYIETGYTDVSLHSGGNETLSIQRIIDSTFPVSASSLIISNTQWTGSNTLSGAAADPGLFMLTGFSEAAVTGTDDNQYTWTISRRGGTTSTETDPMNGVDRVRVNYMILCSKYAT